MTESREEFHERILAAQGHPSQRDEGATHEQPDEERAPKNPFRVAILAIWITAVSLGLILLVIGSSLSGEPVPGDNGFSEIANGWFLVKVGFVILVIWLFVERALWKPTAVVPDAELSDGPAPQR